MQRPMHEHPKQTTSTTFLLSWGQFSPQNNGTHQSSCESAWSAVQGLEIKVCPLASLSRPRPFLPPWYPLCHKQISLIYIRKREFVILTALAWGQRNLEMSHGISGELITSQWCLGIDPHDFHDPSTWAIFTTFVYRSMMYVPFSTTRNNSPKWWWVNSLIALARKWRKSGYQFWMRSAQTAMYRKSNWFCFHTGWWAMCSMSAVWTSPWMLWIVSGIARFLVVRGLPLWHPETGYPWVSMGTLRSWPTKSKVGFKKCCASFTTWLSSAPKAFATRDSSCGVVILPSSTKRELSTLFCDGWYGPSMPFTTVSTPWTDLVTDLCL